MIFLVDNFLKVIFDIILIYENGIFIVEICGFEVKKFNFLDVICFLLYCELWKLIELKILINLCIVKSIFVFLWK